MNMVKVIKWIFAGLLIVFLMLLIWGALIEPYLLDIEEETAVIPNLPSGWEGRQVGVVSDFQVGMWGDNEATIRKSVDRLLEIHPDFILFLGDFIYHAPEDRESEINVVIQMLEPLTKTDIPIYAVLGNHDYQVNEVGETPNKDLAQRLEQRLEAIGIQVLQNEVVVLPIQKPEDDPFYLVGIGAYQPDLGNPVNVFSAVSPEAPRLVIMHNPASFASIPAQAAPFAVAGHTHGGQIRIPFLPEWSYLTYIESEPVHTDGWINDYGQPGNQLYVNRGIGFSLIPIRINCMPEITLFTLSGS
jgi:uncharacterized protein